ncbi:ABC-type transport auxiliary lipoprotein family protein [Aurantimonas sp. MSK8Z-1]|uniref:ABC-type transport auxiliary lipoprotein family protein n=1 Tax=Mangrovibrevibacter kandeliae TaxID=2968473 RepID=UPI0021175F2D|nr:ABC-type transport auxiliary lipoprotein family protein [Aurantimonas sp. MSK8Z-1]MCW4114399.1 ABC-type transport auxiliary lipoprotein family protein [Aurantimonas sp. MSK8Z-1]
MTSAARSALFAALAIGLCSCASLSTPPDTYEISAPEIAAAQKGATRAQLLIAEPTAIKTLDSDHIVVKPTPYTVEFLGNSQWSDRLPRMVQLRLVQAFENTGRVGAVGVPGQGLAIDWQIVTEIRQFEIDVAGGGRSAKIEIAVKMLNDRNGVVRATRVFDTVEPVRGSANGDYVAALDRAFDRTAGDIVAWTMALI